MRRISILVYLFFLFNFQALTAYSQKNIIKWLAADTDTSYITDHTKKVTARAFGGSKISRFTLGETGKGMVRYNTNDHYNVGLGFNYRFVGLNIAMKVPWLKTNDEKYGKTDFFDLQWFIYMRKLVVDLYFQNYDGYYMANRSALSALHDRPGYLIRPDMRGRFLGFNTHYVVNHTKFSYRSAFLQNEHQKRSAGSPLFGLGFHISRVKGDSSLIPSAVKYPYYFREQDFDYSKMYNLSLNGGYAYTYVYKENFFISGAFLLSLGVNYNSMKFEDHYSRSVIKPHVGGIIRFAAGYNSDKYYIGLQLVNFTNRNYMVAPATFQQYETGSIRLTGAYRFELRGKMKKNVTELEHYIEERAKSF